MVSSGREIDQTTIKDFDSKEDDSHKFERLEKIEPIIYKEFQRIMR